MGGDGSSLRAKSPQGLKGVSGGHYSQAMGLRPEHDPPTLHQRILKQQFAKFTTYFSSAFMKIISLVLLEAFVFCCCGRSCLLLKSND